MNKKLLLFRFDTSFEWLPSAADVENASADVICSLPVCLLAVHLMGTVHHSEILLLNCVLIRNRHSDKINI